MSFPPKALLLESIHPAAATTLQQAGWDVETLTGALQPGALLERMPGVQLLGVRSASPVSREVLEAAPDLVAVGAFCIGTNHIDLEAATEAGVAVFNAPFHNTRSVVEMAISQIIALTRRMPEQDRAMHAGEWRKSSTGSHEVRGRTLGIVGYGHVGSQLSVLAEMLGMTVVFYDLVDKLAYGNARRCQSLEELLAVSDVVSLHVDGRAGNTSMFGREQFDLMKYGSCFINLSRGFVVDEAAAADALDDGRLVGAALDVFEKEPDRNGDPFHSVLRGRGNVILTPHTAGSTEEAQEDIGRYVAGKLVSHVRRGVTDMSVNLPSLSVQDVAGVLRFVFTHRNVPGAMAAANRVLADHGINITGESLATRGRYGFALIDADPPGQDADVETVLDAIRALPSTITCRVLDTTGSMPALDE
jgi:D-3-phosphoglycerate dehydrogenase